MDLQRMLSGTQEKTILFLQGLVRELTREIADWRAESERLKEKIDWLERENETLVEDARWHNAD